MKKQKKLYTGVHLLPYADNKMQFGMVDAWANLNEFIPVVRINLNKKKLSNFATEEDTISFEMSVEEAEVLART